ncbi:hypothetical protein Tco_1525632 [Tanacetum coccineum]
MGDENHIRTLGDYSKPSHEGYRNIELPEGNTVVKNVPAFISISICDQASNCLERLPAGSISTWEDLTTHFVAYLFPPGRTVKLVQIFYDQVNLATRRTINQSAGGKLRDRNVKESWAQLEDLALYDNKSWKDPWNFANPMLVEAHLAPKQPVQVNKITSSCEIYNDPYDTQYCMENPEQAFFDYASSRFYPYLQQEYQTENSEAKETTDGEPAQEVPAHAINYEYEAIV